MADVPAGAQPATPNRTPIDALRAANLAWVSLPNYDPDEAHTRSRSNGEAAHVALDALKAAGFEVLPRALVDAVLADLEAAQLRSIEATNPGIDMDAVRKTRAAHRHPLRLYREAQS